MKYPIKCNTVNQFKALTYLDKEFELSDFRLELVDDNTIRLTDRYGETLVFSSNGYETNELTK